MRFNRIEWSLIQRAVEMRAQAASDTDTDDERRWAERWRNLAAKVKEAARMELDYDKRKRDTDAKIKANKKRRQ